MKHAAITLALVIIAALVLAAGCTGTPATPTGTLPPAHQPAPVSIAGTPVQYKDINGARLAYWEWGSGEPVLLIEGFGATVANSTPLESAWNETFLGILSSKYHVYAYDHRGMGYSGTGTATPTIPLYANDAAGLIQALGYDSMHVYGASMGSSTAQQLVIDHPERVRKLVLDSSTYDAGSPSAAPCLRPLTRPQTTPASRPVSGPRHRQTLPGTGPGPGSPTSTRMSCSLSVRAT